MKNVNDVFYLLKCCPQEIMCDYSIKGLACYEKLWWALANKVFEGSYACPSIMNDSYQVYEGTEAEGYEIEDDGDMFSHESFFCSDICGYVSEYYEKSPYWDLNQQWATVYDSEVYSMTEEQRADFCYLNRLKYEDFFESACMDLFKAGAETMPVEYFQSEDEQSESCTVFRSVLLPYYLRLDADMVKQEHSDLACAIRVATDVLKNAFAGECWSIEEPFLSAVYFICFDGYDPYHGIGCSGSLNVDKALLLAGMVIDQAVLCLDKYYHFLPDELKGGSTCSDTSVGK